MSSSNSAGLPLSPAYSAAMEDLTMLLQATQGSVERILSIFSSAYTKSSGLKLSDVRTSLSIGFSPNSRRDTLTSDAHNLLHSEDATGDGQFHSGSSKGAHHQHDVENWFSQVHLEAVDHGKTPPGMNAQHQEEKTSPEETALKNFLEEIKRTMSDWSARQKMMVMQDKTGSVGSPILAGAPSTSALGLPNGTPLSFSFSKEQSPAVNMKAVARQGGKGVLKHHNQKEREKGVRALSQPAKSRELENSAHLDKAVDAIASQLLPDDNEMTHTNHLKQTLASSTQNPPEIGDTAQTSSAAHIGAEHESSSQGPALAGEGNAAGTPTLEEVTPITDSIVTPSKTNPAEAKLPLTKWKPPSSALKNNDKSLSFPRTIEVISSPDWLPEGWVTELKTRGSGNSAGSKDKYYVDPVSNRRFRSRKEVVAYLERSKLKHSGDSPEPSPIKKIIEPGVSHSLPKKSHKKAKAKEGTAPSSSGLLSPMVPPIASSGAVASRFMPPFRTGQPPSEWLLYESLASLPFPMFDPFYYSDMGANKSGSGKNASHMPARPWFFSGPEASWSPFMDRAGLGKAGDKGRDYHSYYPMPPYSSEAAGKSSCSGGGGGGGGKKSSKRKSPD